MTRETSGEPFIKCILCVEEAVRFVLAPIPVIVQTYFHETFVESVASREVAVCDWCSPRFPDNWRTMDREEFVISGVLTA